MVRRWMRPLLFLAFVLTLSGCRWPGFSKQFVPGADAGSSSTLRGKVAFADTNLGVSSGIHVGDQVTFTQTGDFTIKTAPGTYAYEIHTLLGTYTGKIEHDGREEATIRVPAFQGWSEVYFNRLLTDWTERYTVRWPRGASVPVWIQTPQHDPQIRPSAVTMAWSALQEWQQILGTGLSFERVLSRHEAEEHGLVVMFGPPALLRHRCPECTSNTIGLCSILFARQSTPTRPRGEIMRGEILLAFDYQTTPALHRHEIGHCIGLSHSPSRDEVLYPTLQQEERRISVREQRIAQLLYSIPVGTPAFPEGAGAMRIAQPFDVIYVDHPDGTVSRTMPTRSTLP